MNKIKIIVYDSLLKLSTFGKSVHIGLFFLYIWLLCDIYLRPIGDFVNNVGIKASPHGFVFLFDRMDFVLLFFLGVVFAFGDVPYINNTTRYVALRMGITAWIRSQLFYLWICSFGFMLAGVGISFIPLIGKVEAQNGWGKIYGTLAQTSVGYNFSILLKPDYQIMVNYDPWKASACILIIGMLLICLTGKILFLFSMWYKRIAGVTLVLGAILFSAAAEALSGFTANFFSPFSWIRLGRLSQFRGNGLPVLPDVITILIIFHVIISGAIYLNSVKKDFYC